MISKYNPYWQRLSKLYKINDLAFQGEWALKNSDVIKELIMPTDTMDDPKNPKREYLWERYKQSALYTNYPAKYLKQAIGLATKEKFVLELPPAMEKIEDYATLDNLSLQAVENEVMEYVIKFGSALLITKIPDEAEIATDTPKIEVIPGCDVLDAESFYDREMGLDRFKRITFYKQEYIFDPQSNSYKMPEIYIYVKGINFEGRYFEAKMLESSYSKFNFDNPEESKDLISLSFPKWFSELNFIPAVYVNKDTLKLEWKESPIQNLIDTSLSIFQMTADMRFLMHQQSSSTLVISGTDMDGKGIRTGVGNVLNLVDGGSKGEYIAPSVAGLNAMQECLSEQHKLAQSDLLTLTEAGAGSSGEALALRLNDKTSELIGIVSIVGKALQRELELIGKIMNQNIDEIVFSPYIGFGGITNNEETSEDTDSNNEDENINRNNENVSQE